MKLYGKDRAVAMRKRGVTGDMDANVFRCGRHPEKRRYDDKRLATREAKRLSREHGSPTRIYRCPACGDFHLTTVRKARRAS